MLTKHDMFVRSVATAPRSRVMGVGHLLSEVHILDIGATSYESVNKHSQLKGVLNTSYMPL